MRRRDEDPRPPIDVLGADLGISSTQQVAVGPRRPAPRRGRAVLAGLVVAAALIGGLALGDGDDDAEGAAAEEERDGSRGTDREDPLTATTARRTTTTRRPTTTTTEAAPLGPLFGQPLEGALLVQQGASWSRFDLATGARSEVELPQTDPFSAVAMAGGLIIPAGPSGEVRFYPLVGVDAEEPEFVVLGLGDRVVPAGADHVWLFDHPGHEEGGDTMVRLVDLRGNVLRAFEVPSAYPWWATDGVVLLSRGGRVYTADESGLRAVAVGWVSGATATAAVVTTCDERGDCSLRLEPTDGRPSRRLREVRDPDSVYHLAAGAPDGRLVVLEAEQRSSTGRAFVFDPSGRALGELDLDRAIEMPPQWLPGDLGFVVRTSDGIGWARPGPSGWEVHPLDLSVHVEAFYLVTA